MAKGTFGEHLKRERELREVSLDEVAKGTRIAERFLQALENEQWDRLPAGVFGRGFVRSIARYLGLSEENLLAEYDLARGESANPASPRPEERIPSPPKWMPAATALAIAALVAALVLGGRYAWKAYQAHRAQKRSSAIVGLPSLAETPSSASSAAAPYTAPAAAALALEIVASSATCLRVTAQGPDRVRARFSGERTSFCRRGSPASHRRRPRLLLDMNGHRLAPRASPVSSGTIVLTRTEPRQANGGDAER